MKTYTIDKSFYDSKGIECIGIAKFRVPCIMDIKDKAGKYIMTKQFIENYPVHIITGGQETSRDIALKIIPVKDLARVSMTPNYKEGYNILMTYWDSLPDELKHKISKELEEIGL